MSIADTDAQETLAAWRVLDDTGDVMPLLRQSIKGERERDEALKKAETAKSYKRVLKRENDRLRSDLSKLKATVTG